jgi:endonuclease/exonuclease/phosphatase family metal-dependent hydrolase
VPVRIATFNANNLFSRWSFEADLPRTLSDAAVPTLNAAPSEAGSVAGNAATGAQPVPTPEVVEVKVPGDTSLTGVLRTFQGRLVRGKDPKARDWIARRIAALDADVLCLQEVEDQDALDSFHREDLARRGVQYPFRVVVEGNDRRRIDVAVCSRLPITRISSWRFWPGADGEAVFSRDLLQAEVTAPDGKPLRIFVNHLKSNFIQDEFKLSAAQIEAERERIADRRTAQATAIRGILRKQRMTTRVVMTGDMNDAPDSPTLSALADAGLVEQVGSGTTIAGPKRTGAMAEDQFGDLSDHAWTHRHKAKGPATFHLYDQIWTSPDLPVAGAHVMRRTQITGDGSDHDPACVDLDI